VLDARRAARRPASVLAPLDRGEPGPSGIHAPSLLLGAAAPLPSQRNFWEDATTTRSSANSRVV
jgi:hypothetical protein